MAARRETEIVTRAMRAVRSTDTSPERDLRGRLWRLGLRYRLRSKLTGRPDLVFSSKRVVVFVDGDFWHGRQWLLRGFESLEAQMGRVSRASYWVEKLQRNIRRDAAVNQKLSEEGWAVVRVWESDLRTNPEGAVNRVLLALGLL